VPENETDFVSESVPISQLVHMISRLIPDISRVVHIYRRLL